MSRSRPAPPAALGVGSARFPVAKVLRWGAGAILAGSLVIAGSVQVDRERQRSDDERRRVACQPVDPAIAASLVDTVTLGDDEEVRGAGAARGPGGGSAWMVSVELAPERASEGALVEILTWALPERGGAPDPSRARAVDRLAQQRSSVDPAPELVTSEGALESRWCAKDASRRGRDLDPHRASARN